MFHKPKPPDEVLQDWAGDISKMLNLVEMTCHLINKESMLHKDVLGLTIQARAGNLLGGRNYYRLTVYDGSREGGDVLFHESADRRIGPIFRFVVSGDF